MIARYGLGCPREAVGLNGPSYPYPLRALQGLGDEATPANISAVLQSVYDQDSRLADYASTVANVSSGKLTRVPGEATSTSKVPDYYLIDIGSYEGTVTGWTLNSGISATDWGRQLAANAAQANAIVVSTSEPTPAPISRVPIRTPMPTPVQPPSQLTIYQAPQQTDVNAAMAQPPVGVTPTTGPTQQIISVPPIPNILSTGVQTQYTPVSTVATGYATAGTDGQVPTSPISDFLQGTMIDEIPNWLLIVAGIGAFALFKKGK